MRVRAIYYDDKYTNYTMYLDYLIPTTDKEPNNEFYLESTVKHIEKYEIIDGIPYTFDVLTYRYNGSSDNFDKDHCSYYNSNIEIFKHGMQRRDDRKFTYINNNSSYKTTIESVSGAYNSLISSIKKIPYIHILRSINAKIEIIDQFTNNFSQNALVANENYDVDNFFSVQIRFVCEDFNLLTELLSIVPQSASGYFQLSKNYIFLPEEGLDDDENIYTLKISMNPACFTTKQQYRKSLNIYLLEIKKAIDSFYNFD